MSKFDCNESYTGDVGFGSKAEVEHVNRSATAIGGEAVTQIAEKRCGDRQKSAMSGH